MAEADGVYVLDTGSTDGTAERLACLGAVVVEERVEPGGLTRPATALWSWYRRTRTSVCVPIWMRCFTRAAGGAGGGLDGRDHPAVYRYTWNFNPGRQRRLCVLDRQRTYTQRF